jgi:tetratricopeptide (TPR) repeat protein
MSYITNPLTPYAVVSKDKLAVDTLKFPRQTLEYRSGDCSDLSLLYCALMESIQVETAFITIPGHIFVAFALKAIPEEARAAFSHPDELIFRNEKAWVPVEVTDREGTFLSAWRTGASEWRDNLAKNQADFYPVHDAWKIYEPVGLPGSGTPPALPDAAKILKDFQDDVSRHIDLEIYSRVAVLQAAITKSKESSKTVNALGVLYARYDLQDRAEGIFRNILEKEEYVPALVNLANLRFLKKDMKDALAFYQRAYKRAPADPNVLLGIARTNQELENYGMVKETYDELKKVAPKLAQQFAYLELKGEESTRAAAISGAEETVVWDEE